MNSQNEICVNCLLDDTLRIETYSVVDCHSLNRAVFGMFDFGVLR